jgi:hypothetical protein
LYPVPDDDEFGRDATVAEFIYDDDEFVFAFGGVFDDVGFFLF